jgi:hypothetical protein
MLEAVEEYLATRRLRADDLLRPPLSMDEACVGYCPRCEQQYTRVEGACQDCAGVSLLRLDPANRAG